MTWVPLPMKRGTTAASMREIETFDRINVPEKFDPGLIQKMPQRSALPSPSDQKAEAWIRAMGLRPDILEKPLKPLTIGNPVELSDKSEDKRIRSRQLRRAGCGLEILPDSDDSGVRRGLEGEKNSRVLLGDRKHPFASLNQGPFKMPDELGLKSESLSFWKFRKGRGPIPECELDVMRAIVDSCVRLRKRKLGKSRTSFEKRNRRVKSVEDDPIPLRFVYQFFERVSNLR